MFLPTITNETIETYPLATFQGPIHVVDTGSAAQEAAAYLRRQEVLGFDTETKPAFKEHSPRYKTALLQLATREEAFLFHLHKIGLPPAIANILADPKIVKVGAAVHDDIKGLQQHRHYTARSFVDLQKMVEEYGINEKSVKKMAAIILDVKISKKQQLSNWEAYPLTPEQCQYAATDAYVCWMMYQKLKNNL